MKYKLAVFDLDGTLLDTLDDLTFSVNFALEKEGFPVRTREDVRRFVGNGIRKLIERAVPNDAESAEIGAVYRTFCDHYAVHCMDNTLPYDGITDVLAVLRRNGIKTAVVSNKADFAVASLCDRFFDGLFDVALGERVGVARKPSPDCLNFVMSKLNISANETVYIGDSEVDIETAKNAGVDCISVLWGFRDKDFLIERGAKTTVSSADELIEYV